MPMMLKARVMNPRDRDDISEALAYEEKPDKDNPSGKPFPVVPAYIYRWHPNGEDQRQLKAATITENSRDLIHMTRYYPTLKPPVVVDFEPAPPELFWEEEKRRFCIARGIVYIPIYLGDKMDTEGFLERRRACERLMVDSRQELEEDTALVAGTDDVLATARVRRDPRTIEEWLQDPELIRLIDEQALQHVQEMVDNGRRLTGIARLHVLRKVKADLVAEVRREWRRGVDPRSRDSEPAAATE